MAHVYVGATGLSCLVHIRRVVDGRRAGKRQQPLQPKALESETLTQPGSDDFFVDHNTMYVCDVHTGAHNIKSCHFDKNVLLQRISKRRSFFNDKNAHVDWYEIEVRLSRVQKSATLLKQGVWRIGGGFS